MVYNRYYRDTQKIKCVSDDECADDNNACTANKCDKHKGTCYYPPEKEGHICRDSKAPCDAPERCDGTTAPCPRDELAECGTICRPGSGDMCDEPEVCDGKTETCPDDVITPSGTTCRESLGECDPEEKCTGVAGQACPADAKSTAECRPSIGVCDIPESCDGVGNECPEDKFVAVGTSCIDGDLCTIDDKCDGNGVCAPTNHVDCSSCSDQCNESKCENGVCVQDPSPKNGNSCDDGNPCTTNDQCSAGECVGTPKNCNDDLSCTEGICDVNTGECAQVPRDDRCNDNNDCTMDICCPSNPQSDRNTGCMNMPTNDGLACDDRLFCTEGTSCKEGVCGGGTDRDCSSASDSCNNGVCDEEIDQCVSQPANEGGPCGDSSNTKCTKPDTCHKGQCTDNHLPSGYSCSDGNFCNGLEKCDGNGNCNTGIMPPNCDDHDICTIDTCDDSGDMCVNTLITACINGDGCCPQSCSFENDNDCPSPCNFASSPASIGCPFASNESCCKALCEIDPWCCNVNFDSLCCDNACGGGVGGTISTECCAGACQNTECVELP